MRFLETPLFTSTIVQHLEDEDYRALQLALLLRPELGPLIRRSGGLRKVRWSLPGRGKRGGLRVIYFWDEPSETFYMLYAYPKNEQGRSHGPTTPCVAATRERGVRMNEKDFDNLTASIRQAGSIRRGESEPGRVTEIASVDVKTIRQRLGKSQSEFATMIGVSVSTLQNWEQGRRQPVGPARALLRIAAESPEVVAAALSKS